MPPVRERKNTAGNGCAITSVVRRKTIDEGRQIEAVVKGLPKNLGNAGRINPNPQYPITPSGH